MASAFMNGGGGGGAGGELLGKAASALMGGGEQGEMVANMVKHLDKDAISKGINTVSDMLKKNTKMDDRSDDGKYSGEEEQVGDQDEEKPGDLLQEGYGALVPMLSKAADTWGSMKESASETGQSTDNVVHSIANFFEIDLDPEANAQEQLLSKLLKPDRFRPALLKAYRMFVTPTTAETVPRKETESAVSAMMQAVLPTSMLPKETTMDAMDLISDRGYAGRKYVVNTPDGFQLTIFRIAEGRNAPALASGERRPAVFLMHGLLDSAMSFLNGSPEDSLAYVLADAGYDVFMGNARGTRYGRSHSTLAATSPEFWAWSWDEVGQIDVPAMLEFILDMSGPAISYVGHSQGVTAGLAAFSTNPQLSHRVRIFAALAPALSLADSNSVLIKAFKGFDSEAAWLEELGSHEVFPTSKISKLTAAGCQLLPSICKKVLTIIAGGSPHNIDSKRLPILVAHTPAGTSARNLAHWLQLTETKGLQSFKYPNGTGGEEYDLRNIRTPMAVFYGGNDPISKPDGYEALFSQHPNIEKTVIDGYGHLDFLWGKDVAHQLHYPLLRILNNRNGLPAPEEPKPPPEEPKAAEESKPQEPETAPAEEKAKEEAGSSSTKEPDTAAAERDVSPEGDCKSWAADGECTNNPQFMKMSCQKTCTEFFQNCKDMDSNCKTWSDKGECTTNRDFMLRTCKTSCGLCTVPQQSTGGTSPEVTVCKDKNDGCAEWAESGECANNPDYMHAECPASCSICKA